MVSRYKLTMCRLCLSENECFINIFEMNDWQGYVAADVMSDLLQFKVSSTWYPWSVLCNRENALERHLVQFLKVSETDVYPHVVCLTCLTKLTDFKLFKECCQKSMVTYDDMLASHECLMEREPEIVEYVSVKAEPIYHSDNEDNTSKASNDLHGTAGDEFKEEPIEDIVDGFHCLESCAKDPLRQSLSDVQVTLRDTVTHPQHLQYLEHKIPHCAPNGNVDEDTFTRDINTNEEPTFGKLENFLLNVKVEESSSVMMESLEGQWISPGEWTYKAPLCQKDVGLRKEGLMEREKNTTGVEEDGRMCSEKRIGEGMKGFECAHCGKMLMTYRGLITHMKLHGFGHTFDCDICKKPFQGKTILSNHIRTHTGDKPYKCIECSKGFSVKGSLKIHMRSHTGSKAYKCGECSKCFTQIGGLKIHMVTHSGDKPYKCEECSKSFSLKGSLNTHMRSHTDVKPYTCRECSKCFRQIIGLQRHMVTHTGDKQYKCEVCGKSFGQNDALKRHMRLHTGDKPYKCGECGKSFNQSGGLQLHMIKHSGSKPYKCEECGKSFGRDVDLKRHMKTHSVSKPYKCEECGKCFGKNDSLERHMRLHTGDKPYKCAECSQTFNYNGNLLKHMRSHCSKAYKSGECSKSFSQIGDLQNYMCS